ncbi:HNH endonuclease [Pseudomonas brassicacearum]
MPGQKNDGYTWHHHQDSG